VVFAGFSAAPTQPTEDPVVQASPAPVTVPAPVPLVTAVMGTVFGSNFAVTDFAVFTVSVQVFVPAIAVQPLQLLKTEVSFAVAVSVTVVYVLVSPGLPTSAVQPSGEPVVQASPAPVTVPPPVPVVAALSGIPLGSNFAVTVFPGEAVTVHVLPATAVQPLQLLNTDPALGVAVSVTVA
jgi:hypothetical protein